MARQVNKLSARTAATLIKPGRHSDGGGLYLVVERSGSRRWAFLFRQHGRRCEMGLGGLNSVPWRWRERSPRTAAGCLRAEATPLRPVRALRSQPQLFGAFADQFLGVPPRGSIWTRLDAATIPLAGHRGGARVASLWLAANLRDDLARMAQLSPLLSAQSAHPLGPYTRCDSREALGATGPIAPSGRNGLAGPR
jgi:hypothetical protein